jgi:drug/metabolite transporter (DMT)-like permease
MSPAPAVPLRAWLPAWCLLVVVWGSAFLFIKIAVSTLAPLQVAFGRVGLGAAFVLIVLVLRRTTLPRSAAAWRDASVVAFFFHTVPFTLFAYGETHISSVLAGIWNATTPLWTVVIGLAILPAARVTPERWTGLAIGFLGVLVVMGVWNGLGGGGDWIGSLACLAATASYGVAVNLTRKRLTGRPESPYALVGAQLLSGAVQLAVLTAVFTAAPATWPVSVIVAMLLLGVFSTGLAFILNFRVVEVAGPLTSASTTYATPLVSTLAGVLLLGEAFSWNQPAGALIVLAGVALVQGLVRFPRRVRRRPPGPGEDPATRPGTPPRHRPAPGAPARGARADDAGPG